MLNTEYIRSLNANYERLLLERKPEEKKYQYCMISRGGIKGLLPCSLRYIDGEAYVYYDVTARQNIAQLFEKKPITRQWIMDFLWSMRRVRQEMSRFLLEESNIVWFPQHVYQDLEKKEFYFISGAMALGMAAYFTISPMTKTLGMQRGLSETEAVIIIMIIAISNCFGRLISTLVSDRIGCKKVLIALYLISTVSSFTLLNATNIIYMICVSFIAFCYGGFFGVFPIVSIEKFGNKYSGLNYGIIMIGYGIVSLICPYIVTIGVTFALFFATISCIIGAILIHRTLNK